MLGGVQMKYKGIVIKLTNNKAIVTTDDFQCFYIKRKPTTYIGKEVEFSGSEVIRPKSTITKLLASVACILFAITCYFGISKMSSDTRIFAYVDVDINPSLEVCIDQSGNVLKLSPLNKDAETFVDNLILDKSSISEAVELLIAEARKNTTLSSTKKDYVLVSSTLNSKKSDKQYQAKKEKLENLLNSLKGEIQEKEKARVFLLESSKSERKEARSKGISTGRYVLYNKYKNINKDFSIEAAKTVSINELIDGVLKIETTVFIPTATKTATSISTPVITPALTPMPASTSEPTTVPTSAAVITPNSASTPAPTKTPTIALRTSPNVSPIATAAVKSTPAITGAYPYIPLMRFESYNYPGQFIRHQLFKARISPDVEPIEDSIFKIVPGLADPKCISFESKNFPGYYLKHENFKIILKQSDGSDIFKEDATFRKVPGLADENLMSFQSYNYPDRYIRHRLFYLWLEEINSDMGKEDSTYIGIRVQ